MKTLRPMSALFALQLFFLIAPPVAFCQTEKLDIIEYTAPSGWTKTPKDGLMVYNNYDKATGGFCLLTVYPSTASAGRADKDFADSWNERVARPFKASADPRPKRRPTTVGHRSPAPHKSNSTGPSQPY